MRVILATLITFAIRGAASEVVKQISRDPLSPALVDAGDRSQKAQLGEAAIEIQARSRKLQ